MVLESIITDIGKTLINPYFYFLLVIIISYFLFFIIKSFVPKAYAALIALLVTTLALEIILTLLFSFLGTPISFGTYDIILPFAGTQSISTGVMLMRLLDFILDFGFVQAIGMPYYTEFLKTVPATMFPPLQLTLWTILPHVVSSPLNLFVFLFANAGSILDFIFFYYVFAAIIILVSDGLNKSAKNYRLYAAGLALIPVFLWIYFVNTPISSYNTEMTDIPRFFYFLSNAETTTVAIFIATLIISFVFVMEILALVIALAGTKSTNSSYAPKSFKTSSSWEPNLWSFSTQGTSFAYTLAFAIMYVTNHYTWYVFFPILAFFTLFHKRASGVKDVVSEHESTLEMKGYLQKVKGNNQQTEGSRGGGKGKIVVVGLIIVTVAVGYLFMSSMGWM